MTTPVRAALKPRSPLVPLVKEGIQALGKAGAACLDERVRAAFADSLDLDSALVETNPEDPRWDYLLGHAQAGRVVGLEAHSARTDEVGTVIAKKKAAQIQLRDHLMAGACVADWLWVASGAVDFADTERTRLRLDQNGITFVGKRVLEKHLPRAAGAPRTNQAAKRAAAKRR